MSSSRHRLSLCPLAALVLAAAAATVWPAVAAEPPAELAAVDTEADCPPGLDAWVVGTRRLPGVRCLPETAEFDVQRLCGDGPCRRWEPASLPQLLEDDGRPLVLFVHGNRYEAADARSQGMILARRLVQLRPDGPAPRFVIFSWPSQQQGVLLKDGRRKFERAHADGHYLAWLLAQLGPERPVAVVGYSLGALVTTVALEDLTAADVAVTGGIRWAERPGRTHLVFITPALRFDALSPRGPYARTTAGFDRLTLLVNSRDEALRFFPLLDPRVKASALGFVGMPRRWLPAEVEYNATDAAGIVGKLHTLQRYIESRSLSERIAAGVLDGLDAPAGP